MHRVEDPESESKEEGVVPSIQGHLFNVKGDRIATLPLSGPFTYEDKKFEANILGNKKLALRLLHVSDNKKANIFSARQARTTTLEKRKEDMERYNEEIQVMMLDAKKPDADTNQIISDIVYRLQLVGQHEREIEALEEMNQLQVGYTITHGCTAHLTPGIVVVTSFIDCPLVWCPVSLAEERPGEKEHRRTVVGVDFIPNIARYTTSQTMKNGHKQWNQALQERSFATLSEDKFTVAKAGLYRVVCKVNGTTSSANSDHIALYINGTQVSRAMAGLNTGYQIACHLNEVVQLEAGNTFQIYQQFNSSNLAGSLYNTLYVEPVNAEKFARYTTSQTMKNGHKQWNQALQERSFATLSGDKFTVAKAGLYRVVCKVNGTTSSANSDHIALYVNGTQVSRAMAGLNTGYQIACHLNEVVQLEAGNTFQIYQQFDSSNLAGSLYNTLYVEPVNAEKFARYTTSQTMKNGHKQWNQALQERSFATLSGDKFTVAKAGLYRVVCKVNGTTSSANSDHIALYINGTQVSRAMAGLNTGHQIACHLNEVVQLEAGNTFQIYQQFNRSNLAGNLYNTLSIESLQVE